MSNVVKTITVIQELDENDTVVKETVTTVTLGAPTTPELPGMYL